MESIQQKSFVALMKEIDVEERVQRNRGTLFELLTKIYLTNEPMYTHRYDAVWMLSEVPKKYHIARKDTGVDLVARIRNTGKLVAIQCKYYPKDKKIEKKDIDSFLNEVGKRQYSEGIVFSSTDKWSVNAESALNDRTKPITRIGLSELQNSKIDWSEFSFSQPKEIKLHGKKTPRQHQMPAINAVVEGFEIANRGKLIMAPGTGKTYTSMVITEELTKKKGDIFRVLYLVPSIQLLSQTLRGWAGDINYEMDTIAVCSDRKVTKKTTGENELEDIAAADLGYPSTTNYEKLLEYQEEIENKEKHSQILAVMSTYQSIDVIIEAQKNGFYEFDLVICDEAHRTTGKTELGGEATAFTKVHSDENIKAHKRLYQTATPRVYGESAKQKAEEMSVMIADMDDESLYGKEFYRLGFGEAVNKGILTDYKVMVLAVDETMVARRFQNVFSDDNGELKFDDVTKIIGCWNGLIKRKNNSNVLVGKPMKRAIAFTGTIKESIMIKDMFKEVVDLYINASQDQTTPYKVEIDHADGTMNALQKNEKINWLKSDVPENTCRILSNARFLTEGVDVPDLDAVMFLKPRKSKIDIAQAVGRVMRKAPGKEYGYVILPIGIPEGKDENTVLDNNEKYRVVWEVLNALRSLDERFDATINKLELNKKKPAKIQVVGVGDAPEDGAEGFIVEEEVEQLEILSEDELTDLEKAIYGKIVKKVGNVRYWEDWSKDVAKIAQQHIMRISAMLEDKDSYAYKEFDSFLSGLRHNINESISQQDAVEMLAQHMITKPVFDALFEQESFAKNNPVSQAMDGMIVVLESLGLAKEQEDLEGFYESVRVRADGIDNLQAKQDIIVQLYDKFFKVGFPRTTEKLGIVFTPTEVVDFIIHSVDDALKKHFGKSISDEGVNVLDPFTGTGTFITRLLQSGLITKEDMLRKYTQELHANEIVLLSYYIAAINIEETYNTLMKSDKYVSFDGIVLTDTFESTEQEDTLDDAYFGQNDKRLKKQKELPITVIIGNPPYSVGQNSVNDDNQNTSYPMLEKSVEETYSKNSKAQLKKSLNDSYIKAFRWASDRIGDRGVISFITNAGFIDSQSADGLRKCWLDEFNYVYVFNLRGDAKRTSGEIRRKEGGNVFGEGSRTPNAITILVKDGTENHKVFYNDIGDYLTREAKLKIIAEHDSIENVDWVEIEPDSNNDWINQRDTVFQELIPLYSDDSDSVFKKQITGVYPARDNWLVCFNKEVVRQNAKRLVENYHSELIRLSSITTPEERISRVNKSDNFIKWSAKLKDKFEKNKPIEMTGRIVAFMHRPFVKKWLYWDDDLNERPSSYRGIDSIMDKVLYIQGSGSKKDFSAIVTELIPNLQLVHNGKGFPMNVGSDSFGLNSNYSDKWLENEKLSKDDALHLIYALLHSKDYLDIFKNDLSKGYPRIPNLKNKSQYISVGEKLVELHLNYESAAPYNDVVVETSEGASYKVIRMKHPKKGKFDTIIFNSDIIIKNIPEKAYGYVVNGKSAIQWIMEEYQVHNREKEGIVDDANLYSEDPKYIFNLLLSIINVSVQTVDLVNSLPPLEIIE
ncbi:MULTISPECIES: DEAD/DEAH box helicase [Enterococcaceae]|uniref:DEAD/DEAH box helicase n=1 Tax=Enterococcaceae TaxID=81852 RepID=UPI00177F5E4C|nr:MULTISPECIES: type ISP restriction/modification enzyme [Enterococcaceae]QOG32400.1 DEAD/DEAH box helicase [Enterococcus casseliflavus]